jgi:formate hydrogenlyase transcriptional activator
MDKGSKTRLQLLAEIEELRMSLDVSQQRLQEANERLQAGTIERERTEQVLEDRLQFETLLAELSAHFVNLPVDIIDSEIEKAMSRICALLDIDRSTLWQVSEGDPQMLLLTNINQPQDIPTPPERMNARDFFPWASQKILNGETVIIPKMTDLPPEASRDRESFGIYSAKSGAYVPLSVGEGPVFGLLAFAVVREERNWPESIVNGFKLVAQVFANALARKRTERALVESESKLSMATNAAGAGLWSMELDTSRVWVTPRTRDLFRFAPDEDLTYESFFKVIHPEDREPVHQAVQKALQSGENLHCDYRVVLSDGSIRWVAARGKRHIASTGEPDRLMGVSVDITERKKAEAALEDRLRFEQLLSGLSARFVNIPSDQVDSEIENGLRQILEFFQVDNCALLRTLPGKTSWLITHVASSDFVPPVPAGIELPRSIYPWAYEKLAENHEVMSISRLDDLPVEANVDRQTSIEWGIQSFVNIPILVGESVDFIHVSSGKSERVWPAELFPRLQLLGEIFVNALQIKDLRQRLEQENIYLQEEIKLLVEHTNIVGQSVAMKKILAQAEQVAKTDSTVLLLGETGTGKDLLARAIHGMSLRKDRPLVTVNCASLPPTLIESELFGREKGAYTGALTRMVGRFEIADGSTIFLDEIGELPLDLQSKLLRVLEDGTFERLGSTKSIQINVRIIAATNRDIEQEVKDGKFRQDLFYRLNVFPIMMPPLRKRPEDIPLLVRTVVKEFQKKMGKEIESIPKRTMQALQSYFWPGNVRELRNVIEHAMILNQDKTLDIPVPKLSSTETNATDNLHNMERAHLLAVLEKTGWRLAGSGGAAEILGLKRTTLQAKIKKLGIKHPSG